MMKTDDEEEEDIERKRPLESDRDSPTLLSNAHRLQSKVSANLSSIWTKTIKPKTEEAIKFFGRDNIRKSDCTDSVSTYNASDESLTVKGVANSMSLQAANAPKSVPASKSGRPTKSEIAAGIEIARLRYENISRVEGFLEHKLQPYPVEKFNDSAASKAERVAKFGLSILKHVSPYAKIADQVLNYSKYGIVAIVLRKDLSELVTAVLELLDSVQRDAGEEISMKKTIIGLYYYAAYKRLERGTEPRIESMQHEQGRHGVIEEHASPAIVAEVSQFLPFAQFAYADNKDQAQWQARNHGYHLVVSVPFTSACKPAFSLLARSDLKKVVLTIRGTSSLGDIFTNGKADEAELFNGVCHKGMFVASEHILEDMGIRDTLHKFYDADYEIAFCGHSLGAGCAIISGLMVHKTFPKVKVYAYAPPACVSENLADCTWAKENIFGLILRDDLVPRASVANVADLAVELPGREGMFQESYNEDLKAIRLRAASLWAPPNRREKVWNRQQTSTSNSTDEESQDTTEAATSEDTNVEETSIAETMSLPKEETVENHETPKQIDLPQTILPEPCLGKLGDRPALSSYPPQNTLQQDVTAAYPTNAIANAEDISMEQHTPIVADQPCSKTKSSFTSFIPSWAQWRMKEKDPVSDSDFNNKAEDIATRIVSSGVIEASIQDDLDETNETIEEYVEISEGDASSPRMVPPGRIVHIYELCGTYKAAIVDHRFKPLRKIELYGNVIDDHSLKNILEAVRCVKAAQNAPRTPPDWRSMGEPASRFCMVCFSDVTWEYTASSEAQQARVMHHCRSCGHIVCDACSQNRMILPEYGIIKPARVCDPCYWKLGFDS